MNFLKFSPFQASKVYRFKDPDKRGKLYEANTMEGLLALIRGYRSQNELPEIPYLETVVENYLCLQPENIGACGSRSPLKRGLIGTLKGGIAVISSMLYNKFAEQEVADTRSEICVNCSFNSFPDKDGFVQWADDIAEQSIQGRKSINHEKLGNCLGCSCLMRSKVFYTGPIQLTKKQKVRMLEANEKCWQVKESI